MINTDTPPYEYNPYLTVEDVSQAPVGNNNTSQGQSDALWKPNKLQGALSRNPSSTNLQTPLGFRFFLKRSPTTNYFVQRCNVPGISLPQAPQATVNLIIPQPGDHIQFEPLVVTFQVDEGMDNYFDLQHWLRAVSGFDPRDYARLSQHPDWTGHGLLSEITVIILNAQKNAIRKIEYHNCWPTQVSTLNFDTRTENIEYVPATAVFYYMSYDTSTDV
jgi:hypothetical protein